VAGVIHFAIVFGTAFVAVFFAAFQSLCVNSGRRMLATGNSILIAASQALLFRQIIGPGSGTAEIVAYALAGAAAVNAAMSLHKRFPRK